MRTRIGHRLGALVAVTVAGALALGGCSSAVTSGQGTASDTLRIGLSGGVNTLDPHNTASVGSDLSVIGSIYSALVHRQSDGQIVPDAAASWSQVDANDWQFTLNPDVTFSNGDALTADAVAWNFQRVLDPAKALRLRSFFTNIDSVTATDEHTVSIKTVKPDADLTSSLTFFYLLDPSWAEQNDPAGAAMGSGPYTLTSFTPKGALTLQARDDYWADRAAITTVEYKDLGNADAEVNALQTGEIDLVGGLAPKDTDRLTGDDVQVKSLESARSAYVKFNNTAAPVDNATVRQALNYAVDKQAIIDSILRGTVQPSAGQILTDSFPGYDSDLSAYPYDPEKAKQLLAQAGYPDGFDLQLDYPTDTYVEADAIVQAVSGYLEQVGVHVHTSTAPFDTYLSKYVKEGNMAQSIYITQSWQTTSGFLGLFADGSPYAYWPDQTFVSLLNAAQYAPNADEQKQNYAKALEYFREQAPVLFLFPQPLIYGTSAKLNWQPSGFDWILPYEMSFSS